MQQATSKNTTSDVPAISLTAARISLATSAAALVFLGSLHVLSSEFDPSWRMVSEYANGHYAWILSLMFAFWAVSSWALAYAIRSQVNTRAAKAGLALLVLAGVGEAMASVFDINHQPFHDIAGYLGILSLPVAAMLISVHLSRTAPWSAFRKALLWTANLTWIGIVLLAAAFGVMIGTFVHSGAKVDPQAKITALPPGVIGLVGWANRLLVVLYCLWVATVAWQAIKVFHLRQTEKSEALA
jgi:hypothetical protein